jgi:DNA-binding MarR family transcriptional regulator
MRNRDLFISPKKMRSFMDAQVNKMLKGKDFKASQIPFIMEIGNNEGVSMKDLCMLTGADKGLTTRVVKALIQNSFVENRSESSRTYELFLTERGREAYLFSEAAMEKMLGLLLECLDEKDIEDIRRVSAKLDKRLDELYKY